MSVAVLFSFGRDGCPRETTPEFALRSSRNGPVRAFSCAEKRTGPEFRASGDHSHLGMGRLPPRLPGWPGLGGAIAPALAVAIPRLCERLSPRRGCWRGSVCPGLRLSGAALGLSFHQGRARKRLVRPIFEVEKWASAHRRLHRQPTVTMKLPLK
jgi:hypothetical protein